MNQSFGDPGIRRIRRIKTKARLEKKPHAFHPFLICTLGDIISPIIPRPSPRTTASFSLSLQTKSSRPAPVFPHTQNPHQALQTPSHGYTYPSSSTILIPNILYCHILSFPAHHHTSILYLVIFLSTNPMGHRYQRIYALKKVDQPI